MGFTPGEIKKLKTNSLKATNQVYLRAPISGILDYMDVVLGEYVSPEQSLFKIINLSKLTITGSVFEADYDKVKPG